MRHPARRLLPLLTAAVLSSYPAAGAAEPGPTAAPTLMRVHFINVGQGAATLIELPCGAMLVDTGGERSHDFDSDTALSAYLAAFFARRTDLHDTLDLVLLTHPHIDHVRGAGLVLGTYTVHDVVDNGQAGDQEDAIAAVASVREFVASHPEVHYLSVATSDLPTDGAPLTSPVLDPFALCRGVDPHVEALWGRVPGDPGWGEDDYGKARFDNENNHSIATRVDFGESSLLITGDLETVAIRDLLDTREHASLDVDIYEVGHHGSDNGTTAQLVEAMSPEWAVMEVGPYDRKASWTAWAYGHPRATTVDLLEAGVSGQRTAVEEEVATGTRTFTTEEVGRAVYATGWDGALVLDADANGSISLSTPDVIQPAREP